MPIFVINVPTQQSNLNQKKSFENVTKTGVGEGYAINSKILPLLVIGMTIIVLDKSTKQKAVGVLKSLIETDQKTNNGISRYNIEINCLKEVEYTVDDEKIRLNRNGITVI
ncbi:MAG: hypothetical protein E6Q33_04300 [Neisseriales bacterium]|nr:MAG: hypothetical protein E6Q33_04300 [Neisseriales bacterium]